VFGERREEEVELVVLDPDVADVRRDAPYLHGIEP